MAMFTTTIQTILKNFSESHEINQQIDDGKSHVFDDSWKIVDDDYTNVLQTKILRHYYMREIGFETPSLFILKLNTELSEIAPKYTMLYNALNSFKDNPLGNIDVTESQTETGTGKSVTNSTGTTEGTSNTKTSSTSTGKQNSTGNGNSDAWQTSNDTPQGGLNGLETNKYLSSAVHNKSTTEQANNSSSNATSTGKEDGTSNTKSSSESNAMTNTTSEYVKKIIGKNSGSDSIDTFQKLYTNYLNIDRMLLDELEPLFMGLWEWGEKKYMNDLKNNIPHFVLPEVYGDSLSYYEILKNLIDNLNKLTNFVNAKLDENTKKLINQYLMNVFSELIYTEENENLNFNFDLISENGTHVYSDEKMTIK